MQIIYGGIEFASDPPDGTVGVLGFQVPAGEQNIQWAEGLRAPDAYPIARGNRKRTLEGSIFPAVLTTLDAAMLARVQFYELLPASGPLVLVQGITIITFSTAVLKTVEAVEDSTDGVGYGLKLSFAVGPPTFSSINTNLVTSTGKLLVTSTGLVIRA